MATELLHVGFGDYVTANRILVVVRPGSAPYVASWRKPSARASGRTAVRPYTPGRRTKAIILDPRKIRSTIFRSGRLVLLALQPETVASRLAELHSGDQHDE